MYQNTNLNRVVRFRVEAEVAGDTDADLFRALRGSNDRYPYVNNIDAPTPEQQIAQDRLDAVVRALTVYAPAVEVDLVDDSHGTATVDGSSGPAIIIGFADAAMGTFLNPAWYDDPSQPKYIVTDITDGPGTGPHAAKTKPGLQSLLDALQDLSYDNGTTGLFGALSTTGNIVLRDGTTTAGAPTLAGGTNAGLTITLV